MRKLILQVATSLDGYIEGPNGEYDWCFDDGEDYGMKAFLQTVDSLLMGRKTYELMQTMGEAAYAAFPPMKEYICSTTLSSVKPGATLIEENVADFVYHLKQQEGKNIWLFGGASLAAYLLDNKLIDEIMLAVHPVILGGGKPVFTNLAQRTWLQLQHTQSYPSGLVMMTYKMA